MSIETFWAIYFGAIGVGGLFLAFWVPYADYKRHKLEREVYELIRRGILQRSTYKQLDKSLGSYLNYRNRETSDACQRFLQRGDS